MPRTFGDGVIHQSHLDAMVTVDDPLPELNLGKPSPEEDRIGQLIADNLVQDGATLQMGKLCFVSEQTKAPILSLISLQQRWYISKKRKKKIP